MSGACSMYWGEVHTGFWWGNLRERGPLEDLGLDWDNTKKNFKKLDGAWTGFIWLRIGTGDGLL